MTGTTPLDDAAMAALSTWVAAHDAHAAGLIEGLYAVGSVALDDRQPGSDIDIVAITAEPADEETFDSIVAAVSEFVARRDDDRGWIDGPYVSWGDLSVPPTPLHRPWTHEDTLHHDAECFEINPITWYVLATRGVTLRGPRPTELSIYVDAGDRIDFVRQNTDTYWRPLHDQAVDRLAALTPATPIPGEAITWSVLGVCRMWFTSETADVTSKSGAGLWAADLLGGAEAALLQRCVERRRQPAPVTFREAAHATDVMGQILERIPRVGAQSTR